MNGENEQAQRMIIDMTRFMSITILILHFYYYCYGAFAQWHLTLEFTDRLLGNIALTGLFKRFLYSKLIALGILCISLLGAMGKKDEKLSHRTAFSYLLSGLATYFGSYLVLWLPLPVEHRSVAYIAITGIGFLLVLSGGTLLSRIIKDRLADDIFNSENETFPQEERLLTNAFSLNLPARYNYKGKVRKSYISIVAPFRSIIVAGSAGSGKTAYCVRSFIAQALAKEDPYTMLVYDFKFPDLSLIAYNHWLKNRHRYKAKTDCFFINFDDLTRTHRGNVFNPIGMVDITDATESARTILLGLNRTWQTKQGDFFVESPINFVTAVIWFLRKYKGGIYCTLPHTIELIQLEYESLFTIIRTEKECEVFLNPFITALENGALEQLEGQVASAKIALARLASPQLYYVLSGDDFTLDINAPDHPKLICMGNNPQKVQTYGAVLSLYINRLLKIINQKHKRKSILIMEEFPTITVDILPTITTGRSNLISTCLVIQDASQLRKDYGKEQADVILNTVGTIISGQVTGDSAKTMSERIGKTMQDRESLSINRNDTSISRSKQLEYAVPASKVSSLSSGEFVGVVADTPDQRIDLKAFQCNIQADFDAINKEEKGYKEIPVIRQVTPVMVNMNYQQIKQDVQDIVDAEMTRILNDASLHHLIIRK